MAEGGHRLVCGSQSRNVPFPSSPIPIIVLQETGAEALWYLLTVTYIFKNVLTSFRRHRICKWLRISPKSLKASSEGPWVVQLVKGLTPGFHSGHHLMGPEITSCVGLCTQWGVCLKILSLCSSPTSHVLSLTLSNKYILKDILRT